MEETLMKIFTNIVKALVALAAVAGAVYAVATYGDKIVAWAKKLMNSCPCKEAEPVAEEVPAEEPAVEEAPAAEEAPAEEPAPAEEAPADDAPVAEDSDFEG